jgi:hypothetical protein
LSRSASNKKWRISGLAGALDGTPTLCSGVATLCVSKRRFQRHGAAPGRECGRVAGRNVLPL